MTLRSRVHNNLHAGQLAHGGRGQSKGRSKEARQGVYRRTVVLVQYFKAHRTGRRSQVEITNTHASRNCNSSLASLRTRASIPHHSCLCVILTFKELGKVCGKQRTALAPAAAHARNIGAMPASLHTLLRLRRPRSPHSSLFNHLSQRQPHSQQSIFLLCSCSASFKLLEQQP